MNDRELLEMAAKAAGIEIVRSRLDDVAMRDMLIVAQPQIDQALVGWNPLIYDGDALRLAVKLKMNISIDGVSALAEVFDREHIHSANVKFTDSMDRHAATRRAIVLAAAEIGKSMP